MHMIITFSASTRWSPTAAPPSTGGGAFPFVHLSPLPCDHNIWFHRAPYTCLRLIKPWPGPWTHFLYFSARLLDPVKGGEYWDRKQQERSDYDLQEQRHRGPRGRLSGGGRSRQSNTEPDSSGSISWRCSVREIRVLVPNQTIRNANRTWTWT